MSSYKELTELFKVLRRNEGFDFWADETPPAISGDLHALYIKTREDWGFVKMVDKYGHPWDPSQAGEESVTIFVFAISEGRGTRNQRAVIPYIYSPSPPGYLWGEPGSWSGLSRPQGYYMDYRRETDQFCGTGDCYCLKCTAAMIIQRNYFYWKHEKVYYLLVLNFRVKFGHDLPGIAEKIMNYYINM